MKKKSKVTLKKEKLKNTDLTNETTISDSQIPSTKIKKETKILDEVKISKEDLMVEKIIAAVVAKIKPDMDLALKNNFEAIKGNVINEINDVREMVENKIPTQLEQPQVNEAAAHSPSQAIRSIEGNDATRNAPKEAGMDKNMIMQMLMQIAPAVLGKAQEAKSSEPSMESMIVQMMMKKMINDMGKSDTQNTAITNYLLKMMLKSDPNILNAITNTDITPHNEDD